MKKDKKRALYEQRIHLIQDYISTHIDQELSLEKLARISAFSPFHFHRIFKAVAGETLYDFIQRIRLEKSCSMLSSNPDMKIINIALDCGFSTPSSFSKAFKKQYDMSPSEYRTRHFSQNSKNGTSISKPGKEIESSVVYISDQELENLYNRRKKMNVKIETLPHYRIAYMRHTGPYGPGNIQVMQKLKKWAITRDLLVESSIILGIAHDNPEVTPPAKCRYDACVILSHDYELEKGMNESTLPGGNYALFKVEHTPDAIAAAWNDILSVWLPDSGYQIDSRPFFERYIGGPIDIKIEPESCEICVPVTKI